MLLCFDLSTPTDFFILDSNGFLMYQAFCSVTVIFFSASLELPLARSVNYMTAVLSCIIKKKLLEMTWKGPGK